MTTDPLITLEVPREHADGGDTVRGDSRAQPLIPIILKSGSTLFVVGPNGSGKSALMNYWIQKTPKDIIIMQAHRRNCMNSSSTAMTAETRLSDEKNYIAIQKQRESRYKDINAHIIIDIGLYDLIASENTFDRRARKAINENVPNREEKLNNLEEKFKEENSVIGKLNNVYKQGSLNIQISIGDNQQIQASRNGGKYGAEKLSDGERNALILSCNILCSPEGTIFFIDEPEQHLHRAIASPLLSALISERPDCAFVIFTHELSLVETMEEAAVLVLHDCSWTGENPTAWDCNLLKPDEDIPNNIKRAILGGRKKILFVEGKDSSLDRRLYEAIYPDFTIHPAGSCSEVKQAVHGLKKSSNLHRVEAYGIIDRDGRSEEYIQKLKKDGIFVLHEFSVESLFYGEAARNIIAKNKAIELGKEAAELFQVAEKKALASLSDQDERLVRRRCYFEIRQRAIRKIRNLENTQNSHNDIIEISFPSPFGEESKQFQEFMEKEDIDALIARYPVRETGVLKEIATAFHYQNCNDYEAAVVACVKNDEEFRRNLRKVLPAIGSVTD